MELIRDIVKNKFGAMEGKVWFGGLDRYIDLHFDKDVPMEYVEKTAEYLNQLDGKKMDELFGYSLAYYRDTIENYPDIIEDIDMDGVDDIDGIKEHMEICSLTVNQPKNLSKVGLNLEGGCDWDEDNGIQWVLIGDEVVYVGVWRFEDIWYGDYKHADDNYAPLPESMREEKRREGEFLTLTRFCGVEKYPIESARSFMWGGNATRTIRPSLNLEMEFETGFGKQEDTQESKPQFVSWEIAFRAPKLEETDLQPGFVMEFPNAEEEESAYFYYDEWQPTVDNKVEVLEVKEDRLLLHVTARVKDVVFRDDSKPMTEIDVVAWFDYD